MLDKTFFFVILYLSEASVFYPLSSYRMTALEKYPSHKSKIRTCWLEKKCLTLALATILSGMTPLNANPQKQKPEKVSPETERVDETHQEDEGKGGEKETRAQSIILPSLNLMVPLVTGEDIGTPWFDFDPEGSPLLPDKAVIDLDELMGCLPELNTPLATDACFFLPAGYTCRVKLGSIEWLSFSGNINTTNSENEVEIPSWHATIYIPNSDPSLGDIRIVINWIYNANFVSEQGDTINIAPNTTFFINPKAIDIPENLPWTENTLSWKCKIWVEEEYNWFVLGFISKQETNGADERVNCESTPEYKTVNNFFETHFTQNPDPSFANNPYRIEKVTVEDKVCTFKIYKLAFSTWDGGTTGYSWSVSNVFFLKVLHNVETANTLTTTPSIEWENWSGTIEFSDTDNTYPAWSPLPTWVPLSITITPDEGTIVKEVIINGEVYSGVLVIPDIVFWQENQNNIVVVCENQTPTHSIDIINWEHGTTEIHDAQGNLIEDLNQVPNGTEIQVKATSDEGYYVSKIEINGVEHLNNHHINPFVVKTIVQSDMTVESFYKPVETSSAEIAQSKVKIWTSKGEIIIMPQGEAISNLIIYNSQGEAISYTRAISEELRVRLRKGVYFVSFDENRKRVTKKVLVE